VGLVLAIAASHWDAVDPIVRRALTVAIPVVKTAAA
jgi:hypothetical protein